MVIEMMEIKLQNLSVEHKALDLLLKGRKCYKNIICNRRLFSTLRHISPLLVVEFYIQGHRLQPKSLLPFPMERNLHIDRAFRRR